MSDVCMYRGIRTVRPQTFIVEIATTAYIEEKRDHYLQTGRSVIKATRRIFVKPALRLAAINK